MYAHIHMHVPMEAEVLDFFGAGVAGDHGLAYMGAEI